MAERDPMLIKSTGSPPRRSFPFTARRCKMVSLDKAVGSLLLGTYLNSCLLVVELFQLIHYFRYMKNDSRIMKTVVVIAAFVNAIDTLAAYSAVYLYAISHWGDAQYLAVQNWPITVHFATTGFVGALVQAFMLYRFWRMTEHTLTVGIIALFSAASFAGSIGTAVCTTRNAYFSRRTGNAGMFVTLWLIAGLVADVSIAASLVWRLHRIETDIQPAKSLIRRLITSAISTGTSTSIIAVIAVFAYFHEPTSNVAISVTFILGRVYSCTMLYLLNNRSKIRGEKADGTVEVGLATNFNIGGIYINRTAVVVRDREEHHSVETCTLNSIPTLPQSSTETDTDTEKERPFSGLIDLNNTANRSSTYSASSRSSSAFSGRSELTSGRASRDGEDDPEDDEYSPPGHDSGALCAPSPIH
ncbi:hypothetical protein MVEN_01801300 [Mycena venus]|uniref:DUF6534 domain-containing protein n=1 Tax=Mycena venus TaxID=2733690 RepID=A0A8H6XKF5_9AGAR|nr:hypothetical protein MVEN_01801300 [Mycena venus]